MDTLSVVDFIESFPTSKFFNHNDRFSRGEKLNIGMKYFRSRILKLDKTIKNKREVIDGEIVYSYWISQQRKTELITKFAMKLIEARQAKGNHVGKRITLISPEGERVTITNLSQFCRERGFCQSAFRKLVYGAKPSKSNKFWQLDKSGFHCQADKPKFDFSEKMKMFIKVLKA